MAVFRIKRFTGNLVGDVYLNSKQKKLNKIIQDTAKELDDYKNKKENLQKGGFSKYKTRTIKEKERSFDNIINNSQNDSQVVESLLNHGMKYGKRSK